MEPGECVLAGLEDGDLLEIARGALTDRLREVSEDAAGAAVVDAVFTIDVQDELQRRTIEQGNPASGGLSTLDVVSLVRTVDLHAEFHVRPPGSDSKVTLEVRRAYDSRQDARTRGPWGLQRPDDPQYVPAAETVARELIAAAVDVFCRLAAPWELEVQMPLKPTLDRRGREGLKQMNAGDYAEAVACFQAGLDRHPTDENLLFNLAVAAEAAGRLDRALEAYQELARSTPDHRSEIHQAVKRIERLIAIREDAQRYREGSANCF
ncbi:MAG: tetratricopeptide repeat protein [Sedimentisphaerales bacterium]|nr:tetratricopeptide repeat protein [Sedimentisphaerales bacterium]